MIMRVNCSRRPTAAEVLTDKWLKLADERAEAGEVLSTNFLKEFKYRHDWSVSTCTDFICSAH